MKQLVLITMLFFSSASLKAQNNLQFSQVINDMGSFVNGDPPTGFVPLSSGFYVKTLTVPAGKVWKIEWAEGTAIYVSTYTNSYTAGNQVVILNPTQPNSRLTGPVWLKAGTSVFIIIQQNAFISWGFSAIEFNVN